MGWLYPALRVHPYAINLRPNPAEPPHGWLHVTPAKSGRATPWVAAGNAGQMMPQRRSMVNLPRPTPRSQPLPVPANASDTSPLVMTCALLDLSAPAWASTEA